MAAIASFFNPSTIEYVLTEVNGLHLHQELTDGRMTACCLMSDSFIPAFSMVRTPKPDAESTLLAPGAGTVKLPPNTFGQGIAPPLPAMEAPYVWSDVENDDSESDEDGRRPHPSHPDHEPRGSSASCGASTMEHRVSALARSKVYRG